MRYTVIKPPTKKEQALIRRKVRQAVKSAGGLRPASRAIGIPASYLGALRDGTRNNPSDRYLRKLGLKRITHVVEK